MKGKAQFTVFMNSLSEARQDSVRKYLDCFREHLDISGSDERMIISDARNALMYLAGTGTCLDEAIQRLSGENLGGFYAHEAHAWYPLDDAAKIYPISMRFGRMPMFRISCYLKQKVVPELLQLALDFTIRRFPSFATIVRKGIFWHYLDSVKRRFGISVDEGVPCRPLRITSVGFQSFKVLYHDNRISCEFFHVLTDGNGGLVFLKALVAEYLRLTGVPTEGAYGEGLPSPDSIVRESELSNDFERFCPHTAKTGGFLGHAALQMSGKLSRQSPCKVVQLVYDTQKLLDFAHSKDITVTALVLTLMFMAQRSSTELTDGKIQIQVPVNMRRFFPDSHTVRNFSMYCSIDLDVGSIETLEETAALVTRQLREKSTLGEMSMMMTSARRLVRSLRFVPLAVKAPLARTVYGFLGDNRFSNTLSNLGTIEMPRCLAEHIQGFDFILGTCVVSRASCSMCSFGGNTVLSVSKNTRDPSFEEALRRLSDRLGLEPDVVESPFYE